jgi:hypothetical protein
MQYPGHSNHYYSPPPPRRAPSVGEVSGSFTLPGPVAQPAQPPAGVTEDAGYLLNRIQSTISSITDISSSLPDLEMLLSRYQDAHGMLMNQADSVRQSEATSQDLSEAFERAKQDMEESHAKILADSEAAFQKEREEWESEKENLITGFNRERAEQKESWDERRNALITQHVKEKDELQRTWMELQSTLTMKADEEKDAMEQEKVGLQKAWDEDKQKFQKIIDNMKSLISGLDSEKERLEKMVDEVKDDSSDVKSKDDAF